jgi:hypothetical protein
MGSAPPTRVAVALDAAQERVRMPVSLLTDGQCPRTIRHADPGTTATTEEKLGKELSILAHDTVDQPPPLRLH